MTTQKNTKDQKNTKENFGGGYWRADRDPIFLAHEEAKYHGNYYEINEDGECIKVE